MLRLPLRIALATLIVLRDTLAAWHVVLYTSQQALLQFFACHDVFAYAAASVFGRNCLLCRSRKKTEEKKEFFNNEWKKMYVAATRAKEHLLLTYSSTISRKGFTFPKTPSRFVANL